MKDSIDDLLKEALIPTIKPDDKVNQVILNHQDLRRKSDMSMFRKMPKAAVIAVCVLCLGSVSVFAASYVLKPAYVFQHGISTDSNVEASSDDTSTFDSTSLGEQEADTVDNISMEEGTADTPWLSKKVEKITEHGKTSDDAVNWEDYSYVVTRTTYAFADYAGAIREAGMDNWFSKEYRCMDNIEYAESICESEDLNERCIEGKFEFGSGSFEVKESKNLNNDGTPEAIGSYTVLTNETSNERTYTNTNGHTFTLADDILNGETRTTVSITYENYTGYITFHNMTEDEIHQVLDTMQIK